MLMKLAHYDITEAKYSGIDHRANAVFNAADKHSIKCYKRTKKIHLCRCSLVHCQMWWRGAWNWPGVCCVVIRRSKANAPIMRVNCYCIPGCLIRSCWYHRRCHQPFQALNRWCPLFLRSCQCPLCGSWENDLTHRQLLSAAWVILYSHFSWGGLSRTDHCKQGVKLRQLGPCLAAD